MSDISHTRPGAGRAAEDFERKVIKGLLWREWLVHRRLLMTMLCLWLIGQWILLLFCHPWVILVFGALFALWIGTVAGGSDAAEGSEEFSFALPATRAQRYIVRMALGGSSILLLTGASLLAIGLDLPQRLWGIFVNSGFTEPFWTAEGYTYALAFSVPAAVFAFSFAMSALAKWSSFVLFSGLLGAGCAAAILGLGLLCEQWLWGYLTGMVSCPALLALGAAGLFAGYLQYLRKEGISRPVPLGGASRVPLWYVMGIVAFIVLPLGLVVGVRVSHRSGVRGGSEAPAPSAVFAPGVMPSPTRPATTSAPAARKE